MVKVSLQQSQSFLDVLHKGFDRRRGVSGRLTTADFPLAQLHKAGVLKQLQLQRQSSGSTDTASS